MYAFWKATFKLAKELFRKWVHSFWGRSIWIWNAQQCLSFAQEKGPCSWRKEKLWTGLEILDLQEVSLNCLPASADAAGCGFQVCEAKAGTVTTCRAAELGLWDPWKTPLCRAGELCSSMDARSTWGHRCPARLFSDYRTADGSWFYIPDCRS